MIAVCIATYNQEHFIAQTIESVQAQVCDEPIRIYIGDDASTDGTSDICKQYAKEDKRIVYVLRTQNIGLTNNTLALYRRIMSDGCQYIAMLDGDDYWTYPYKLQLQIDYLKQHPGTGFVHTNGSTSTGSKTWTFGQHEEAYGLFSVGFANCTVVFDANLLSNELLDNIEAQHFLWLDYPLYGVFYQHTHWAYLPQKTAVWREHISVSQPQNAKTLLCLHEERSRMWKWLDEQFPGKVGYSEQIVKDYLYEQRLNLIYQFNDKTLITPELLNEYKPTTWKQRLKLLGLKKNYFYSILRKSSQKFAHSKKKL